MAEELFTEIIVPEKSRKDLFPDEDPLDPIESVGGQIIVNPRIIGGTNSLIREIYIQAATPPGDINKLWIDTS